MSFDIFLSLLRHHGLRLACMSEYNGSKLVEDEKTVVISAAEQRRAAVKGKKTRPKWTHQNVKEVHLISWNTTDLDNIIQLLVYVEDETWEDLFAKTEKRIDDIRMRSAP